MVVIYFLILPPYLSTRNQKQYEDGIIDTTYIEKVVSIKSDWDYFVGALIFTESRGNSKAIGKTNDFGILQITPIYVREANRILKENKYTHTDALDSLKSLEMFGIVQSYHNPDRCIFKAIKLHNPNAGQWYEDRIVNKMEELRINGK